jgi:hypothetical protein
MSWNRVLLVPLVVAAFAPAAPAGIFSRKPKPTAADRVPELLLQLQSGPDEGQRAAAAEELRQYDAKEFPKIIPVLIDAIGRDASPAVRAEAASTLGKLRPISQQAGYALEQAQNNDAVMRVRLAARQALWQYHLVGYRGGKSADAPSAAGANDVAGTMPRPQASGRGGSVPAYPAMGRETAEPPLATANGPVPAARPQASPPLPPTAPRPSSPIKVKEPATKAPAAPAAGQDNGPALPPP